MYEVVSLSSIHPGQIESTFYFVKLSLSRAGNAQSSSWGFSSETLLIFTIESSLTHIGFLALLLTMMICSIWNSITPILIPILISLVVCEQWWSHHSNFPHFTQYLISNIILMFILILISNIILTTLLILKSSVVSSGCCSPYSIAPSATSLSIFLPCASLRGENMTEYKV